MQFIRKLFVDFWLIFGRRHKCQVAVRGGWREEAPCVDATIFIPAHSPPLVSWSWRKDFTARWDLSVFHKSIFSGLCSFFLERSAQCQLHWRSFSDTGEFEGRLFPSGFRRLPNIEVLFFRIHSFITTPVSSRSTENINVQLLFFSLRN